MPTVVKIKCPHCGKKVEKNVGYVNRAKKLGVPIFCSRVSHRVNKTAKQKKEEKRLYDLQYREKNLEKLKEQKKQFFKIDYAANPEKYRKIRKKRYPKHLEYLRTPEYKEWKAEYDVKYLAKKYFGIYWESAIILKELEEHLLTIRPDGIKFQMGITNKTQKRKRLWQKLKKQKNSLQLT